MTKKFELSAIQIPRGLEGLASSFHQDFAHDGGSFELGVERYLADLTTGERFNLRDQLATFLTTHSTEAAARSHWRAAGAAWLPGKLQLRAALNLVATKLAAER